MDRAVIFLKYSIAVIIFVISFMVCAAIANIGVRLANFDAQGFLIDVLPYFAAPFMGVAGVYGGLYAVERAFSTVRLRLVALVFIGLTGVLWAFIIGGMLFAWIMGAVYLENSFSLSEIWEANSNLPPQVIQAVISVIAAYKLTSDSGDFGTR